MIYETSTKRPGNVPNKSAMKPLLQPAKAASYAAAKKPQTTTSAIKRANSTTQSSQQTVKGWPSRQKGGLTPQSTRVPNHQMTFKGQASVKHGQTAVQGWPHHQITYKPDHPHQTQIHKSQPGVKYTYTKATAKPQQKHPHTGYAIKPGNKTVAGWPHHRNNIYHQGIQPTQTAYRHPQFAKSGYKYPQRWSYSPGTHRPYYYQAGTSSPTYVNVNGPQPVITGNTSPSYQSTVPAGCPMSQNYGTVPSTPRHQVCHTCGGTKGCITLSRFAFNSAQIKPRHKSQLRELAMRILNHKINVVITTGHTDSSGSEDYNEALGEKRANAVIGELKKQLSMLKPNGHKHLFWRTDSKGETQPVSTTNPANNRRVEICIKHGKF